MSATFLVGDGSTDAFDAEIDAVDEGREINLRGNGNYGRKYNGRFLIVAIEIAQWGREELPKVFLERTGDARSGEIVYEVSPMR